MVENLAGVIEGQEGVSERAATARGALRDLAAQFDFTAMDPATRNQLLEPFQQLINDLSNLGVDVTDLQLRIDRLKGKDIKINVTANYTGLPSGIDKSDVLGFSMGGLVSGIGGPKSDMIPAMLSNGEFVIRAQAVDTFGPEFFAQLNRGINPLAGMDAPGPSRSNVGGGGGLVINGGINVTTLPGEKAEESVPRALRKLAFVAGL
jgi:hypothetical protein